MKKLIFVWNGVLALAAYMYNCGTRSPKAEQKNTTRVAPLVSMQQAPPPLAKDENLYVVAEDAVAEEGDQEIIENSESYSKIVENTFHSPQHDPLSTFSIDVDRASYSNVRRFIEMGQLPPKEAVRIEELVNYFAYDYPQPESEHPFEVYTEMSAAPWNAKHQVLQIGIQGKSLSTENLPASNLVFLIDVSGSMADENKLPLVIESFKMLVNNLRAKDRIAIVVYAGAAGVVLEPTPGNEKEKIVSALERLEAGGSTAGGEGLRLAYKLAAENYLKEGNNRVIIASDGDFNVGESSDEAMEALISEKRKEGVYLTVLGYGMGNYKDSKMEILADKGNGNYAYIDNLLEARKTLVNEFGGTLFTIAKDVKIQVEFNPAKVQAFRLIGYENRVLRHEDFNNDKKDAGELGAGHTVTALYEIIPAGVKSEFYSIDSLKYQPSNSITTNSNEWLTIKLRYKKPDQEKSRLIVKEVTGTITPSNQTTDNFKWSTSVAAFGMLLRQSEYVGHYSFDQVIAAAELAKGKDEEGYRSEFVRMVKAFGSVAKAKH